MLPTEDAWGLRLAAEVLAECLPRERLSPRNQAIHDRIRTTLPALLADTTLPANERVAAALHLARIGDPRPGAVDLDAMEFCRVPAGTFFLGATDPDAFGDETQGAGPHRLAYAYWLARWPGRPGGSGVGWAWFARRRVQRLLQVRARVLPLRRRSRAPPQRLRVPPGAGPITLNSDASGLCISDEGTPCASVPTPLAPTQRDCARIREASTSCILRASTGG